MENSPLLSVCIPIYNRVDFLRKTLCRFLEDRDLFYETVELYLSDNCSTDDIEGAIKEFREKGLRLNYHRNITNLGMDGNFANCFKHANGKYIWLLGSDDTPVPGILRELLAKLSGQEYGVLHLANYDKVKIRYREYDDSQLFLVDINFWITFISGNIVNSKYVSVIEFEKYDGTLFTQVPLYLEASLNERKNAIWYISYLEKENDSKNNGGYHFFEVFVLNLLGIFCEQLNKGRLKKYNYEKIKKILYKRFVVRYVVDLLVLKKHSQFKVNNGWGIIRKEYGSYLYAYTSPFRFIHEKFITALLKNNNKLKRQFKYLFSAFNG